MLWAESALRSMLTKRSLLSVHKNSISAASLLGHASRQSERYMIWKHSPWGKVSDKWEAYKKGKWLDRCNRDALSFVRIRICDFFFGELLPHWSWNFFGRFNPGGDFLLYKNAWNQHEAHQEDDSSHNWANRAAQHWYEENNCINAWPASCTQCPMPELSKQSLANYAFAFSVIRNKRLRFIVEAWTHLKNLRQHNKARNKEA